MTQTKAIATFCRECAGAAKDVTLCTGLHCQLWPFRLGCTMRSKVYAKRVRATWAIGGAAVDEVKRLGFREGDYLRFSKAKAKCPVSDQGEAEIARPGAGKGTHEGSGATGQSDGE